MEYLKNKAHQAYLGVATNFVPVLKDSKFLERGVLTPEEYIIAGDQLTHKCPTWQWESGTAKLQNKNLPPEKQFLVTRNVPCSKRIKDLGGPEMQERELDDGWVEAENPLTRGAAGGEEEKKQEVHDIDEYENQVIDGGQEEQDQNQEAVDIDDIKDDNNILAKDNYFVIKEPEDNFHKVRSYDLSITYDFYYQTPRLWLQGYNEDGQLLKEVEVFEDIMADYANKTVTMEPHPHQGIKQASIHPCNHAKVMKKIIDTVHDNGGKLGVHQSLFVFLKFISSVVPTIEYDFTLDLELE